MLKLLLLISTRPQLAVVFTGSPEMSLHGEDKPEKHKTAALDSFSVLEQECFMLVLKRLQKIFGVI